MARFNELYDQVVLYTENTMYMEGSIDFKAKIRDLKDWVKTTFAKAKARVIAAVRSDNAKAAKAAVINAGKASVSKAKSVAKDLRVQATKLKAKVDAATNKHVKEATVDVEITGMQELGQQYIQASAQQLAKLNALTATIMKDVDAVDEMVEILNDEVMRVTNELKINPDALEADIADAMDALEEAMNKFEAAAIQVYQKIDIDRVTNELEKLAKKVEVRRRIGR